MHQELLRGLAAFHDVNRLLERAHAVHGLPAGVCGFLRAPLRGDEGGFPCGYGRCRCAGDGTYGPVESEFAEHGEAPYVFEFLLARSCEYRERYGQVVSGPFLREFRRSEVDDYLPAGEAVPVGLQGGDGAEQRLLHGGVGEADEVYADAGVEHLGLYGDGGGFDAVYLHGVDCCNHCLVFFMVCLPASDANAFRKGL